MQASRTIALADHHIRRLLIALAATIALALAACGQSPPRPAPAGHAAANDITAEKDARSITIITASEVRDAVEAGKGRVTLVNFWATWCPPCVKELPHFAAIYDHYERDALHFLSITADHKDTLDDTLAPFLEERDLPFPILLMDAMPDDIEAVLEQPFPGNLPVTLLYDASGGIAQRWDREVTLEELHEAIDALLS